MASERRPHVVRTGIPGAGWLANTRTHGEVFCDDEREAYQNVAAGMVLSRYLKSGMALLKHDRVAKRLARYLAWVDRRAAEKEQG